MKHILYILCLALIVQSCNRDHHAIHPVRQDITQAVYASGKLFPLNHYTVLSKFPGYVEVIHVKPGQHVKTGQALISIRNEVNDYNIDIARNSLSMAKQNADPVGPMMKALRDEIASARSKYELDSLNFHRTSELMKQQAVSVQNFDQVKTQYDISSQNYRKTSENFITTSEKLRIELLNAQNQLNAQISNQQDYHILSEINGKVYDIVPEIGDLVSPQMVLLDMGDSSRFEVELAVDETDVSFIQPGEEVVYAIDAYRERFFKGIVTEIFPKVNSLSKTSRIKASFEAEKDTRLYSGMSVEANIVIRKVSKALVIPKEFVKNGNMVMIKGKDQPVAIQKGAEDLQFVEITSGLSESDEIVKF